MKNKPTFFDILLVLILLALSVFFVLRNHFDDFRDAEVFVDGLSYKLNILQDGTIKIKENFVVEIKSGKIRVALSECPQKICTHSGWISKPGASIICLPNKVAIVIKGKNHCDAITR